MSNDQEMENEIVKRGLTAPRVSLADLKANIASEYYFTAKDGVQQRPDLNPDAVVVGAEESLGLLTFCVLVLKNGFTVTGESAVASPENFDPEIGRTIARQKAEEKIWSLMGYHLKQKLSEQ